MLNFIHPTSGTANIFGKDSVKDSKEIRKQVGYLPSEVHYYDDMKALDLLQYSAKFHQYTNNQRIVELAEKLHLDLNKKLKIYRLEIEKSGNYSSASPRAKIAHFR